MGRDELPHGDLWRCALVGLVAMIFLTSTSICCVLSSVGRETSSAVAPVIDLPAVGIDAAILALFFLSFGSSSGARFTPAKPVCIDPPHANHQSNLYVLVQSAGAITCAAMAGVALPDTTQMWSEDLLGQGKLGVCSAGDLSFWEVLLVEVIFSTILLFVVHKTVFNVKQAELYGPVLPPVLIASTVGIIIEVRTCSLGSSLHGR
eukprot:TRINITY_DN11290_c0_g1_i1.p1 TRINITY_DN11290_c0_g1~~TRINITY_DN11290_c0_g1_i1.p1  ORF type:complete len:205 (-),score=22.47 TRINITY_DN11290_c0_g1_i1:399-1013(-)